MKRLINLLVRLLLPAVAAPFVLSACSAWPTAVAPGVSAGALEAMRPAARSRDLLYVSNWGGNVGVYRYWQRRSAGKLVGFRFPLGECVDGAGSVYVSDFDAKQVVEFAHGGTKPTRTFDAAPYKPYGCSVYSATGNVAVAAYWKAGGKLQQGGVLVFPHGNGNPAVYTIPSIYNPRTCSYDGKGNLMVSGSTKDNPPTTAFAVLKHGTSEFVDVSVVRPGSSWSWHAGVQWDGAYWAVEDGGTIFRYRLSGDEGIYRDATVLSGSNGVVRQFWIANFSGNPKTQGTQVVVPVVKGSNDEIAYWKYPAGGNPIGYAADGQRQAYGVTVSLFDKR